MTHASRDTTTGLEFEAAIRMKRNGIDLSKHKLYAFLKARNINCKDYISKKLIPDEAYYDAVAQTFTVYEKKCQHVNGSADEKLETCAFKISQYRKLAKTFGVPEENVTYTYVLNSWFKDPHYSDALKYIRSVDGCNYVFTDELN